MMSLTIIAIGAAVLLYAWLAYGLILAGLSRRVAGRAPRIPDRLPAINVLLAAHNEAAHIRPRLENLPERRLPERAHVRNWVPGSKHPRTQPESKQPRLGRQIATGV